MKALIKAPEVFNVSVCKTKNGIDLQVNKKNLSVFYI